MQYMDDIEDPKQIIYFVFVSLNLDDVPSKQRLL